MISGRAFKQSDINKKEEAYRKYNENSREISLTALVTTLYNVSSLLNKHRHDWCQHVVRR